MELTTIENLNEYAGKLVYCVNTDIIYDKYDGLPKTDGEIYRCKLDDIGYDKRNHPYEYEYALYKMAAIYPAGYMNDGLYNHFKIKEGETIGNNGYKIFSTRIEAIEFRDKHQKKMKPEIEKLTEELKRCTVSMEQIAEKFDIDIKKLRIVDRYGSIINK